MAKILYVWELGGGYGHIGKIFYIGRHLEQLGHQVSYPVRDLPLAHALEPEKNALLQAPFFLRTGAKLPMAINYSDVLLRCGFADSAALGGLVRGWRQLFELAKPDVVLFDHAPSAMLSAMTLGIPGFNIGSGFMVPQQNQNPMPSLQPWAAISDQARFDKDRAVLQSINQVLTDFNFDPLERVNQLFGASRSLLMTWPELDHYPQRSGDTYHGPVLESQRGAVVDAWANSSDPRVFIYLSASYKPSQRLFEQLRGKPYSVLAHVRDNSAIQVDNARYNNIFLSSRPLDLHQVLPNTDLAITHGGQTTSALALKHGIPMLLLPQHLEQAVLAHRLAKQRLASSLWLPDVNTDWCQVVNSALGSGAVKQNLQSFRQKYQAHDSEQTAASIAQIINQSL